ncbi:hypothetical protein SAMN05444001_103155 [Parabacteroides chinchillae]|uniref:Uncharacterized protein n=1 Tax=Parabacteroides chinchillae TaxID=871327 RepID=A0A8G2F9X4_9BACT|nr:hypothetical protein SAMN05444001_103155 [Parabacteroides chinchillae]
MLWEEVENKEAFKSIYLNLNYFSQTFSVIFELVSKRKFQFLMKQALFSHTLSIDC